MRRHLQASCLAIVIIVGMLLVSANSARAVTFGWEAIPSGGIEYIVQVEPDLLDTFARTGFTSDLPPGLHDVRSLRVVVGSDKLPHQGDTFGPAPAADRAKSTEQPQGSQGVPGVPGNSVGPPAGNGVNPKGNIIDLPPPPTAGNDGKAGVAPPATFGGGQPETANPSAVAADKTPGDAAKSKEGEPPAQRPGGIMPPLFNGGGWAKSISDSALAAGNSNGGSTDNAKGANPIAGENATLAAGGMESTTTPRWPANGSDANTAGGQSFAANHSPGETAQTGDYNRDNWSGTHPTSEKTAVEAPTPKPWWLLVLVLLVLFASIGANVYLVWIHQAVRAKYLALVDEMPRQAVAT